MNKQIGFIEIEGHQFDAVGYAVVQTASGINQSMASGGITLASDIPVHREVYEDAAEYFDPYATMTLVKALKAVLYDADAPEMQSRLRKRGLEIAARYSPELILPQWKQFLRKIVK